MPITHEEFQLMRAKSRTLLSLVVTSFNDKAAQEYAAWLEYMAQQRLERGHACLDCRLDKH